MSHSFLFFVASASLSVPIIWLSRRGGLGARSVFERAREELDQNRKTSVRAPLWLRIIGFGPLDLDTDGFSYSLWRSKHTYIWADITRSFTLKPIGRTNHQIGFYVCIKNKNKGRMRIFADTKSEFIQVKRYLGCSYCMGWDKLLIILNQCWNEACISYKKSEL